MNILELSPEVNDRDKDVTAFIDADYIAYVTGGISQSDNRIPQVQGQEYVCLNEEEDIWKWVDPYPLVEWRIDEELNRIKDSLRTNSVEVWLTPDKGNFRDSVAVTRPYKGNRKSQRPYWYQAIRDHLVNNHGATIAVECEADDMVCTRQMDMYLSGMGEKSVIVGRDKDLRCMFGNHFNPKYPDVVDHLTPTDSAMMFYGQMVTGDPVDNIPGCKGRGKAALRKAIDRVGLDIEGLHNEVINMYRSVGHDDHYILEQANLLHMRRQRREQWDFDYDWEYGYVG